MKLSTLLLSTALVIAVQSELITRGHQQHKPQPQSHPRRPRKEKLNQLPPPPQPLQVQEPYPSLHLSINHSPSNTRLTTQQPTPTAIPSAASPTPRSHLVREQPNQRSTNNSAPTSASASSNVGLMSAMRHVDAVAVFSSRVGIRCACSMMLPSKTRRRLMMEGSGF